MRQQMNTFDLNEFWAAIVEVFASGSNAALT